jgi:phosphatidylglycerol---prolipoprotein diacylglyceryl transferase
MIPIICFKQVICIYTIVLFQGIAAAVASLIFLRYCQTLVIQKGSLYLLLLFCGIGATTGAIVFHFIFFSPIILLLFGKMTGSILGSIYGCIITIFLFTRFTKIDSRSIFDALGMAMLPGIAVARIGCFAAGCCHGIQSNAPWAVTFRHELAAVSPSLRGVPIHPTQLYESILCIGGFMGLQILSHKYLTNNLFRGILFILALTFYSITRFIVEFWRYSNDASLGGVGAAQIVSLINLLLAAVLFLNWFGNVKIQDLNI